MPRFDPPATASLPRSRAFDLNTPQALALARVLVPCLFGLYSLWLGADANWDLYNYHLYNPFAWLNGKLQTDLAPAGMQSYFNPLLDVTYYLANLYLPSRVVGFAMGALHGLSFVFLLSIARAALPDLPQNQRYRVPLLLALAGCLTANFLSVLGNSMGDDTTALFVLAALSMLVANWGSLHQRSVYAVALVACSGLLAGFGVGLKLTNAVFAVAMCAALLFYPGGVFLRIRLAFLFGVGVLVGFAVTGGYWMSHMWETFGNPLYPQFGALFSDPLVRADAIADTRWRPHDWIETALWPFVFAHDSKRVGEASIRQIIWPIVYVLFWLWLIVSVVRWVAPRREGNPLRTRARFVVVFVAIGYLVWMQLFSIYRYIVAIEVLTPLVVWILLHQLLSARAASRVAGGLIALATVVVVAGGAGTWGHEGWADPLWHAERPAIAQPAQTTVVIATTRARAWGWIAALFPTDVAFTQIDSSFPATPAFDARMRELARTRGGPIYALIDGEHNWRVDTLAGLNATAGNLGLTRSERGCAAMRWAVTRLRLHASVVPGTQPGEQCALGLRADDVRDTDAENRADREAAAAMFERHGFTLDAPGCAPYRAGIGKGVLVYQWCRLSLRGAQ
ncbi:hypothetical protein C7401_11328 [Paraburkholderia unamae]|uniref:hypothetical protein n=1 Tax=Paraburkholderia unamae TaxID=219649 RepID=UPI000DC27968|nr:hypothetical protein [Paraburkholderia unamae]RAR58296.1 hypothetical protein C7401_11328 [Paraburkholderia unamae]